MDWEDFKELWQGAWADFKRDIKRDTREIAVRGLLRLALVPIYIGLFYLLIFLITL